MAYMPLLSPGATSKAAQSLESRAAPIVLKSTPCEHRQGKKLELDFSLSGEGPKVCTKAPTLFIYFFQLGSCSFKLEEQYSQWT